VTDDEFIAAVLAACRRVPNAEAVALGGSRARGDHRSTYERDYCRYWADTTNPISCAGALARVVLQCAHARLAHRGAWALNEKRMVQAADLEHLYPTFSEIGSTRASLSDAIAAVERTATDIAAELGPS
jgi:hypothetical protein